jgi:flagellin
MSVVVNTNIPSIASARHLASARAEASKSMQKLASGVRINTAADDAAGLTVAAKMRADVVSLNQALRNVNDAISMIGVYLGAADEIEKIFLRGRELAIQASSGTYTQADLDNAQLEYRELIVNEIARIKSSTTFNTLQVADNHLSVVFQIGAGAGDRLSLTFPSLNAGTLMNGPPGNLAHPPPTGPQFALGQLDEGLASLNSARTTVAAVSNRLEYTASVLMKITEATQTSLSRVQDTDFAFESASLAKYGVLTQAASAMLAQSNQAPEYVLSLLRT